MHGWTAERVKDLLPAVTLRLLPLTPDGVAIVAEGDTMPHAIHPSLGVVVFPYHTRLFHAFFTWEALADALNAGQPIPY